jgi:hypothetical protein
MAASKPYIIDISNEKNISSTQSNTTNTITRSQRWTKIGYLMLFASTVVMTTIAVVFLAYLVAIPFQFKSPALSTLVRQY